MEKGEALIEAIANKLSVPVASVVSTYAGYTKVQSILVFSIFTIISTIAIVGGYWLFKTPDKEPLLTDEIPNAILGSLLIAAGIICFWISASCNIPHMVFPEHALIKEIIDSVRYSK